MLRTDTTPGSVSLRVGTAARLDVPVEDAPDEGRDQEDAGLRAGLAWGSENSSVRLQSMPSFWRISAARMPSQVEAILIRMRSRPMPRSL